MFRNNGVLIANKFIEYVICEQLAKIRIFRFIRHFKNSSNPEIKEIVDFYRNNKTTPFQKIFPYSFTKEYKEEDIEIFNDGKDYYVIRNGKELYIGNNFENKKEAILYYQRLLIEQNEKSPHRYLTDKFCPWNEDVVFDVGGAEGIFSLDVIDKCKKIYIFECDEDWFEPLKKTFSHYSDKVVFVNKYVDAFSDSNHITIDDFVEKEGLTNDSFFIKIDAEGSERLIIDGAQKTLENNKVKLAICTYHKMDDEKIIRNYFKEWKIQTSRGYMFFIYDFKIKFPYIRRGVLRIKK